MIQYIGHSVPLTNVLSCHVAFVPDVCGMDFDKFLDAL